MGYRNKIVQEDMKFLEHQNFSIEKMKNKKIMITGASGMLATYIVYFCMYLNETKDYNIRVYALVRNEKKAWGRFEDFKDDKNFRLLVQDVCEPIAIEENLDYIVHAAGNASPQFILNDPVGIINANTVGTMNVMELAKKMEGVKVLYTSTREVYGKMPDEVTRITEDSFGYLDPMDRRACYPESKRIAESILQGYFYQYGVKSSIVRIAHSYGPGMAINNDGRVMADFISDVVNNRNIVLKSTGEAVRAFCYITDAVSAMLLVLLDGENGMAYNIANEKEPQMIREVARDLVEAFPEKSLKVVFDIPEEMSLGYSKMGRVELSTEKVEKLGWRPEVSLREGMVRTVRSFEEDRWEAI